MCVCMQRKEEVVSTFLLDLLAALMHDVMRVRVGCLARWASVCMSSAIAMSVEEIVACRKVWKGEDVSAEMAGPWTQPCKNGL